MNSLYYFSISISILLFSYAIGASIQYLYKIKSKSIFFPTLFGLIILVTLTAIFFTRGKTILLGLIPVIFCYLYELKKENSFTQKLFPINGKEWFFHIITGVILFAVFCCYYIPTEHNLAPNIFFDVQFYGDLAYSITHGNGENKTFLLNAFNFNSSGFAPYHWFDIWFIALVGQTSTISYCNSYYTIFAPVMSILVFMGAFELIKLKTNNNLISYGLAVALALMPMLYINLTSFSPLLEAYIKPTFGTYFKPKNLILTAVLIFAWIHHYQRKDSYLPLLILLLLPILDVTTAPIIFALIGLIFLYTLYKDGLVAFSKHRTIILNGLIVCLIFVLFYVFLKTKYLSTQENTDLSSSFKLFVTYSFKYLIGLSLSLIFAYLLAAGVLLLYHFYFAKKNYIPTLILLVIIIGSTLLTAIFNFYTVDSYQLMNIALVALNLIVIINLGDLIITVEKRTVLFFGLLSLIMLHNIYRINQTVSTNQSCANYYGQPNRYSEDFLKAIAPHLNYVSNPIGISVFNKSYHKIGQSLIADFNSLNLSIQTVNNSFTTTNLSSYKMYFDSDSPSKNQYFLLNTPYSLWKLQKQKTGASLSESNELAFIKEYGIEFGIFEDELSISDEFSSIITCKIVDPISREVFVLFTK